MSSSAYLFDDVLTEILLRLPPECVLRSRAVSRRWRPITTCPAFVEAYSRRRPLELLAYPDGYRIGSGAKNALAGVDPAGGTIRRLLRFHDPLHLVDS
ncbi:hypothetical protein C2845_PM12G01760 [Panicum miliaceum]|uniref:F-box domain-containing protein n=1 Tax=Panicum miliaceum TaxID=4540 RepID=A0A3L6QI25_PANMI|nr:hypothetical protein C2845_PM12G01760 [Panicum miliaceum]